MQGPTIKTYFAQKMGIDPEKIVNVAVTPARPRSMKSAGRRCTRRAVIWELKVCVIWITALPPESLPDGPGEENIDFLTLGMNPMTALWGEGSGAGVIFGNTGGCYGGGGKDGIPHGHRRGSP